MKQMALPGLGQDVWSSETIPQLGKLGSVLAARVPESGKLLDSWPNRDSISCHLEVSLQMSVDMAAGQEPGQVSS